jgi:hypothetical protein
MTSRKATNAPCPSVDMQWRADFKHRMDRFSSARQSAGRPVSIKIRIESGCFHREHSPEAYRLIDEYCRSVDLSQVQCEIVEHESGPEVLAYIALTAAALGLAKPIIELVTAIIKARSEGIKLGDRKQSPLELIVRGHSNAAGDYYEERILRMPPEMEVTPQVIEEAINTKMFKPVKGSAPKKKKTIARTKAKRLRK